MCPVFMIFSTSHGISRNDYENPLPFLSLVLSLLFTFFPLFISNKTIIHSLVIHSMKPLSSRCHMKAQWTIPVVCLHSLYIAILVGVTAAVHHIEFRFDELKDLWRGILVSVVSIGTLFLRFYKKLLYLSIYFKVPSFLLTCAPRLLLR